MRFLFIALSAALLMLVGCSSSEKTQTSQFKTYSDFSPGPDGGVDWYGQDKMYRRQSSCERFSLNTIALC